MSERPKDNLDDSGQSVQPRDRQTDEHGTGTSRGSWSLSVITFQNFLILDFNAASLMESSVWSNRIFDIQFYFCFTTINIGMYSLVGFERRFPFPSKLFRCLNYFCQIEYES